ncbi:iron ABC transporter permease [Oceanisphaera profunda]|uniref:Iron ABC transporter permease n=1 Tax=Oceanisphaera profunda TaxID=1416627 RepID=A0A1Y0D809_9GAMM|nr:iron ABC transporter permease [Oceanisphaera profunda]ART83688.1 iron ABC transporter permease [Oceanisphaera profunda]
MNRTTVWPALLLGLVALTGVSSLATGPMALDISNLVNPWRLTATEQLVLVHIRLPRTLLCLGVGAILAICGAIMQGLFRNPLADPGIIGVSGGAALGAAVSMVILAPFSALLPAWLGASVTSFMAFIGGLVTTLVVYRLARTTQGTSVSILLLAGVAIGALSGGVLGLLNYLADDQTLRDLTLWQMGSMAQSDPYQLALVLITALVLTLLLRRHAHALNALALGEAEASHLGIEVQSLKRRLVILAAIAVGVTVAAVGIIGFVGLVVPHLVRLVVGPDHRRLLPLSALLGAWLLLLADMLARTIAAPAEMPVGIITALLGAPFFLWLLLKQKRGLGLA